MRSKCDPNKNANVAMFVLDHDRAVRDAAVRALASFGMHAIGFATIAEFVDQFTPSRPCCLLIDLRMDNGSGLHFLQSLSSHRVLFPIIASADTPSAKLAVQAMLAGALSVIAKPYADEELVGVVQQALHCEQILWPLRSRIAEVEARLVTLTKEELAVYGKVVEGQSNKQIACELDIGLRTTELRRSQIMKKMGASSWPELVRMAVVADLRGLLRDCFQGGEAVVMTDSFVGERSTQRGLGTGAIDPLPHHWISALHRIALDAVA